MNLFHFFYIWKCNNQAKKKVEKKIFFDKTQNNIYFTETEKRLQIMLQFFSLISDSLGSVYKVKELFLMVNK